MSTYLVTGLAAGLRFYLSGLRLSFKVSSLTASPGVAQGSVSGTSVNNHFLHHTASNYEDSLVTLAVMTIKASEWRHFPLNLKHLKQQLLQLLVES